MWRNNHAQGNHKEVGDRFHKDSCLDFGPQTCVSRLESVKDCFLVAEHQFDALSLTNAFKKNALCVTCNKTEDKIFTTYGIIFGM